MILNHSLGRQPVHPWELWLDGRWHVIRQGVDFECAPGSIRTQLSQRATNLGRRVGTRAIPGGFLFRFYKIGERLFDRDPQEDGVTVSDSAMFRRESGRPAMYPWSSWTDGRWHIARPGENFECAVPGFVASIRRTAASIGKKATVRVVPGCPENVYGDTPTVVFIFLPEGERPDLIEADRQLAHERRR